MLVQRIADGKPLKLVEGGEFEIQPVFVDDVARLCADLVGYERAFGATFNVAGPEVVTARRYYGLIAEHLGTPLVVEDVPRATHLSDHPEDAAYLCDRTYDLGDLDDKSFSRPMTKLKDGLRETLCDRAQPSPASRMSLTE